MASADTKSSNFLEENLNEECKKLILTLPKDDGPLTRHLYQYQGFWYYPRHLQGVVSCQKNLKVQESDIFLVTPPKSGTTWLKALTFTTVNRAKFPVKSTDHPLKTNNPHDLIPFLEAKFRDENPDLSSFPSSKRILATHISYESLPEPVKQSNKCKIVYVWRDPKDVFVSLWHFVNRLKRSEKDQIEDAFNMFCKGFNGYGPIWDHILGYWNKSNKVINKDHPIPEPEVLFLKYEDLKAQPGECLRRVANFLNCPFSDDEERSGVVEEIIKMCSFDHLSSLETNNSGKTWDGVENNSFFRCGVVGDSKNYLSVEMVERVDRITEEKFRGSSLIF